jgi:hypothetical protein
VDHRDRGERERGGKATEQSGAGSAHDGVSDEAIRGNPAMDGFIPGRGAPGEMGRRKMARTSSIWRQRA